MGVKAVQNGRVIKLTGVIKAHSHKQNSVEGSIHYDDLIGLPTLFNHNALKSIIERIIRCPVTGRYGKRFIIQLYSTY